MWLKLFVTPKRYQNFQKIFFFFFSFSSRARDLGSLKYMHFLRNTPSETKHPNPNYTPKRNDEHPPLFHMEAPRVLSHPLLEGLYSREPIFDGSFVIIINLQATQVKLLTLIDIVRVMTKEFVFKFSRMLVLKGAKGVLITRCPISF